jgi:hypothetical protein
VTAARVLEAIRDAMINASSNPMAAFVLIALVALAVLLALMLLITAFIRPGPDDQGGIPERTVHLDETVVARAYEYPDLVPEDVGLLPVAEEVDGGDVVSRPPRHRLGVGWIAVAVIAAASTAAFSATSTDRYCADSCHAHGTALAAHACDAHADISCVACHEGASVAGFLGAPFIRAGHAVRAYTSGLGSPMPLVSTGSCLGCHGTIRTRTVAVAELHIRMSHRAPLAAGMSCSDCHASTGHHIGAPLPPSMTACTRCHDGRTAAAACPTCHSDDASRALRPSDAWRAYATVTLAPMTDCGRCHDQTACDACHGVRLPHTAEFKTWSHARAASFDGRTACDRCHVVSDCTGCHLGMKAGVAPSHPADWKTSHQAQPGKAACECHWDRLPDAGRSRGRYCLVCH